MSQWLDTSVLSTKYRWIWQSETKWKAQKRLLCGIESSRRNSEKQFFEVYKKKKK